MRLKLIIVMLFLFALSGFARVHAVTNPTMVIKVRRGNNVALNWTYSAANENDISGFKILWTDSLSSQPVFFRDILKDQRSTIISVTYPGAGKYMYFVVQAVDIPSGQQSGLSNSVGAQKIGP
jgi:hypothetical protein